MTIDQFIEGVSGREGALFLLAFLAFALWKEWLIPGARHHKLERKYDELQQLIFRVARVADRALDKVGNSEVIGDSSDK